MTKRAELLLGTRRSRLLGEAAPGPTRRKALLARVRLQPTRFQNRSGRHFFVTLRGSYVVLEHGRRLYGRKARFMDGRRLTNTSSAPARIRPKRI